MLRRLLLAAAAVAAVSVPSADAAPPYCVVVSDSSGSISRTCVIDPNCIAYGQLVPNSADYCIPWP